MEKQIPVKIVTKEQMNAILGKGYAGTLFGYGAIGNKTTGKIVEIHKVNRITGEKTVLYRNEEEYNILQNKLKLKKSIAKEESKLE